MVVLVSGSHARIRLIDAAGSGHLAQSMRIFYKNAHPQNLREHEMSEFVGFKKANSGKIIN